MLEAFKDALTDRPVPIVLSDLARSIQACSTFVVAAHGNPDGDALGSMAALGGALRILGKAARIVVDGSIPEKYAPLFALDGIETVRDPNAASRLGPVDCCILLDTSEPDRAGSLRDLFFAEGQKRLCVDHHLGGEARRFDQALVVPEAPATGSLVLALIDRLGVPLDARLAQALWIAVATDTGWFRFENTTEWALEDAARLARAGVDIPGLHRRIYEEYPLARARILGTALAGLRSDLGGAFVWSVIPRRALDAEGLAMEDLDGVVEHLKSVRGAAVVALIVEREPRSFKVSLRASGTAEVESVARRFGGGGHRKAAGCRFSGSLETLLAALSAAVADAIRYNGGEKLQAPARRIDPNA